MGNEVKIKLTDAQKAKIKEATGKDLPEIRVESFGSSPARRRATAPALRASNTRLARRRAPGPRARPRVRGRERGPRARPRVRRPPNQGRDQGLAARRRRGQATSA